MIIGVAGGAALGPSSAAFRVARITKSLASLFPFMVPLSLFSQVAKWTHKFCYEDWAVEKIGTHHDGGTKNGGIFQLRLNPVLGIL